MDTETIKKQARSGIRKFGLFVIVLIAAAVLASSSFSIVESGTIGIVSTMGAVQDNYLTPGLHFRPPFISNVRTMNIQTKKVEVDSTAASRDLQVITTTVAVNYHIDATAAVMLYKNVGMSYEQTIIAPAIQEAVKAVIARFSAEQLITKRQEVSLSIKEELAVKFSPYGIITDEFNITNLDFSAEFNAAIEAKQTAQQQALKAEQDLTRVTIEAQQKVEQAKAEAEATKARADAEAYAIKAIQDQLAQSENYLEYQKIEKWNGELPKVQGEASTIIDFRDDLQNNE